MKVKCSNLICKKYFSIPTLVKGPPGIRFQVENCTVKCPYCGKVQLIENGEYVTNEDETYTLKKKLDTASLNNETLNKLLKISIAAKDETISLETYKSELQNLGLGDLLPENIIDKKSFLAFLISIIVVLNVLISKKDEITIVTSSKKVIQKVEQVKKKEKKKRYPKRTEEKYSKSLKEYLKSIKN